MRIDQLFLKEYLNNPLDFEWVKKDSKWWKASFEQNGIHYWVNIYAGTWEHTPCWTIDFGIDHKSAAQHNLKTTAPSGLRKPHFVISTVKAAFEGFMAEHRPRPQMIVFYDSDGVASRTRVYGMFANYVCHNWGYTPDTEMMAATRRKLGKEVWLLRKN